jgi:ABC-type multidrug transport system fused ATPase/permease subunit
VDKSAKGLKSHLESVAKVRGVLDWVKKEIVDQGIRDYTRKMLVYAFVLILLQMGQPYVIGRAINALINKHKDELIWSSAAFCLLITLQKVAERYMGKSREWILGQLYRNQDKRITELFFEKSVGQHIQDSNLSTNTVDKGRWKLLDLQGRILFDGAPTLMQIAVSLVFLFMITPIAGVIMTLALIGYLAYSIFLNHNVMTVCEPIDKSMRALNRRRLERMEMTPRVKISDQEDREIDEMTDWFDKDLEKDRKFWFWFIDLSSWRSLINITGFILAAAYAFYQSWHGQIGYGAVYAAINWTNFVSQSMWRLSEIEHQINWNLPTVLAMIKILSIKPDITESESAIALNTTTPVKIEFCDVGYMYPSRNSENIAVEEEDKPDKEESHTLKRVSFTINKGDKVALLGPSGSGKSTLARLCYRAMDPTRGSIRFDGRDLRDIKLSSLMQSIGYIPQQGVVFNGTVRENLTYRLSPKQRAEYADDKLWDLVKEVHLTDGLVLEHGLDTVVGKHGLKLSGGQIQRLMIAAAIIGNPWLMIVDEATSSLDSTTERNVQKGLERALGPDVSAIIIAHRLSTVRHLCNKFVVLKPSADVVNGDSQVEAVGINFAHLYMLSPTFRQLAIDQDLKI